MCFAWCPVMVRSPVLCDRFGLQVRLIPSIYAFLTDRFLFVCLFFTFAHAAPHFCHCISQHIVTEKTICLCMWRCLIVLMRRPLFMSLPPLGRLARAACSHYPACVCICWLLVKSSFSLLEIKCASYSQKENPLPVIIAELCSVH